MTLGQNKKIMLSLVQDYAPENALLTEDTDMQETMNLLYSVAYFNMAQLKKIRKSEEVVRLVGTSEHYTEYDMPTDLYQLEMVLALDKETNKPTNADYYTVNNKLYINDLSEAKYIVKYFAYPTEITEETSDDFELEIDLDVQHLLPYEVAGDILKADPSANYVAFENKYINKKNSIDIRTEMPTMTIDSSFRL